MGTGENQGFPEAQRELGLADAEGQGERPRAAKSTVGRSFSGGAARAVPSIGEDGVQNKNILPLTEIEILPPKSKPPS